MSSNTKKYSGNQNPKKASHILGNGAFQSTLGWSFKFQGTETPEKNLISENVTPQKIIILPKTEHTYISGNGTFLYFGKSIFRTLTYSEPETYSNIYDETFCKIATWHTLQPQPSKCSPKQLS